MIGALEDAEDYKAFEAAIIADYDVQSAVERELVLRLASLLWRLRRATTMETGLFEIQADYLREFRQGRQTQPKSQEIIYARFARADSVDADPDRASHGITNGTEARPSSGPKSVDPATDLARCFLRLANLPSYPLDRLSRYEAILWRQAAQILFALDALDRRKPQERGRRFRIGHRNTDRPTDVTTIELSASTAQTMLTQNCVASASRLQHTLEDDDRCDYNEHGSQRLRMDRGKVPVLPGGFSIHSNAFALDGLVGLLVAALCARALRTLEVIQHAPLPPSRPETLFTLEAFEAT